MNAQAINIEQLPTTPEVSSSLLEIFSKEEIDLRDITAIALQDSIVFINIILLVNKFFHESARPVVNTVQAAINLVGLSALKEQLLSIKNLDELKISKKQKYGYYLIRNRIYTAANMTSFWAEYMGEKNIEELYCASMFTGINDLYGVIAGGDKHENSNEYNYLDSIDSLKDLYPFDEQSIGKLPDSIQQIFSHSSYTKRLSLSVEVYELITALEYGYITDNFFQKLKIIIEHIDQSASRATYDLACQIVQLHKNSKYSSYNHANFLIAINSEAVDPLDYVH